MSNPTVYPNDEGYPFRWITGGKTVYSVARTCTNCGNLSRSTHEVGTESPDRVRCPYCDLEYAKRTTDL